MKAAAVKIVLLQEIELLLPKIIHAQDETKLVVDPLIRAEHAISQGNTALQGISAVGHAGSDSIT